MKQFLFFTNTYIILKIIYKQEEAKISTSNMYFKYIFFINKQVHEIT